jgi:hypothetical protein
MFLQSKIKNLGRSIVNINKAGSTVTTMGQVLVETAGLAVAAAAGATILTIKGVSNQAIAAAEALTQVPVIELFANDEWIADSTNNSDATHNGQLMVLTDSNTVNNTGTTNTSGVVKQVGVYGAAADKKIIVTFVPV